VRDTAARELQIRGERSAFERAVQLLKYKAAYKRETATFLLGQLGTPKYPYRAESIPLIEKMCKDKDISVRNTAITSLGHLRAKESIGLMLEAAHDEDASIRIAAAFALSMVLPDARAEEALEVLKNDPDEEVRYWAED
jgi:HEAT repeat protein